MNCCGQKRQSLQFTSANDTDVHEPETENNLITSDQKPVYFRYTGNNELQVKGIFNITYTFSAHRPRVLVHPDDVSVMRGYPDLVELRET
ncbi:hypothetical protein SAMN05421820_101303 [Pedobacter steynii]|uniref:Uncharacterized protein n=1 Tax=Pedobacter steynii TaxID=430522 RepID=A0A1G9JM14_9SPHI|nr:hypothetical protein [Pedobacter steynii]NQX38289.1 hypothetical protein [Pedobacter steynii]SDL38275.1 hypothetical protein SAMN05421820_101303 [Pedobacter steynii]